VLTPGELSWLKTLEREGAAAPPRYGARPCGSCRRKGWTETVWIDARTRSPISAQEALARNFRKVRRTDRLTPAGRAILAELSVVEPSQQ
jgi:hypothetical protein